MMVPSSQPQPAIVTCSVIVSSDVESGTLTNPLPWMSSPVPDRPAIQTLVGIAAGVHYLSAHGIAASSSLEAHDQGAVSALATASAGVAVALGRRVALVVEADLMMLSPTVAVRVGDAQVATIDRFALFTHGGLLATF